MPVIQRKWRSGPRKIRRVAWGFTAQIGGKQVRKFDAAWSKDDAARAEATAKLGLVPTIEAPGVVGVTFGQAVERYLMAKSRKKSLPHDRRLLAVLVAAFGATTPLSKITAAKISAWRDARLSATSTRTRKMYAPATVNRPLAILHHLLRLAVEEWELLAAVPRVRLPKEPQGRIRLLEPEEEARLLEACRASQSKELAEVVTVAMESGMRQGEIIGLEWPRVDLSRGVFKLEITKSGKRREVPMRQIVYNLLAGRAGPREGAVWSHYPRKAFENAVEAAGLEDFHFHDCRHHFASWFMMRGGSLQALKEILGHATLTMTMRYAHLSPDHLRSEMAKTERPAESFSASSNHGAPETADRLLSPREIEDLTA